MGSNPICRSKTYLLQVRNRRHKTAVVAFNIKLSILRKRLFLLLRTVKYYLPVIHRYGIDGLGINCHSGESRNPGTLLRLSFFPFD